MDKPFKPLDQKASIKLHEEVLGYLRVAAPQVKFFSIDHLFTGEIEVTERADFKNKPGYKQVDKKFASFDELKKEYGKPKSKARKRDEKPADKPRSKSQVNRRTAKRSVAKAEPKKANVGRNDVRAGKAGRQSRGRSTVSRRNQ